MNKPIAFGKYYLLERINVGGMAEVFKGKAFGVEGFERLVAVKRILPNIAEDEEFITMFIDEAKIAVQLQHANIAQIFDLGKVDDSYFIALEYVHGKDLRAIFDHVRRAGELMPMPQATFIVMQLCEGLDYAHNKRDPQGRELNLVHRDVSPQNMLVGYEGEIKLVDFGIAKAAGKASKTQAGILKGKFGYMSPEQVRGLPVDRRSDIFSLGIVLYELLTGERLFIGESDFSTLEKVRNVEILPPSSFNKKVSPELERIVLKALAKDVEDRYQNAIDLHDDLQAFLYSIGEFYSRKDLSTWMKKTFAQELAEENAKLEEYQQAGEPTPLPPTSTRPMAAAQKMAERRDSRAAEPPRAAQRLEWDEEELETQIFDKVPDSTPEPPLESMEGAELDSSDIMLQPDFDDKTVVGEPPAELLASEVDLASRPFQGRVTMSYPPVGPRSPTAVAGRSMGAPPAGLAAHRHPTSGETAEALPAQLPGSTSGYDALPFGTFDRPLRQTAPRRAQGVSFPPTPVAGVPERRLAAWQVATRRSAHVPLILLVLVLLGGGGYLGFRYMTRPGRLQVEVKPTDAKISLDGAELKRGTRVVIEKQAGVYHLSIEREGYVRKDQNVEITAGQFEKLEVELEPSPDTGFELTSEPPGGLVWLDGQPFTGGDDQAQQARTNFKAYRVAPGRHVLEIKNDARFQDWKYEFFQEPGKTRKIHADLQPRTGAAAAAAVPAPTIAEPSPTPALAPRPDPEPARKSPPARSRPAVATVSRPRPVTPRSPARTPATNSAVDSKDVDVFDSETKLGMAPDRGGSEECTITLGSRPWSEVWIDGKSTGKVTPLVDYKISCGKHKITFKNPELKIERSDSITVRSGEKFKKIYPLVDTQE